ncbi:restriction endonuclease [Streptomyces sp. VNUA24]|uniref:restriction endonuclease n=1 Tax=Streptomyces sp. VNUA24 TaxID=3031131 RepID=UPI0023B7B88A|nr:restriction endonuclease [Streptomyces sp. VNUA24]WEH20066.1 restriction endonuclease [Streptomyces sp. VNUA24]
MARRRSEIRRPRGAAEWLAAALVAVAALVLAVRMTVAAGETLLRSWPLLVVGAATAVGAVAWRALRTAAQRRRAQERLATLRITLAQFDAMDDEQFEYALRDLLIRDGWQAWKVGQGGDQAADVIGQHPHHGRIVLQAKHTRTGGKVGSSVMYQVNGTARPVHGADHAVVVTNGALTRNAKQWGDRHRVRWTDRDQLRRWAENGIALQELLRLPAGPRRTARWRTAA